MLGFRVGALLALLVLPVPAYALPAFARRFNLACGACHAAVPRLNAYGEAFHENGFKPPGTMWTPLPGTWTERVTQGMAVWTRGEFFEHSNFARGPDPRGSLAVPEHTSVYLAGPLTPSTSVFVELEHTAHETDINRRGDFVNSNTGGMQKGFLMVDLPMLFGLHGGHTMDHTMDHAMDHQSHSGAGHEMDGGMATMGDGLVGHGPMVMIGRVDPSTNFSYAVDRQIFHDVPTDTSKQGFLLRLGLTPYAFGAKFFGIFKRGDHTLLPVEPTLYHTEAAPGIDFHGRLFASRVLYQFGLTTDAAPEFTDRFHTTVPYTMLRYDFGDQDGLNGSVSVLGNYGRNAYRVFYLAPAPLPFIPAAVPATAGVGLPQHRPPPPPGRGTITGQRDLDVWREMLGMNLRRGRWDLYGAYSHDQVFDVPEQLAGRFERRAQGLTAELDYRLTHTLLPSLRYDWMDTGGFKSDVLFEPGPRQSQVLHLQMRWYVFEGDDLARVPIPALLVVSLRDSINLTPGGAHPFGAWQNSLFLGFDFAF